MASSRNSNTLPSAQTYELEASNAGPSAPRMTKGDNVSAQNDEEAQRIERLRYMEMEALGLARKDYLATYDLRKNIVNVDLQALEAVRLANRKGTEEYRDAQAHKESLSGWNTAWATLKDDGTMDENLSDLAFGQTHRERLMTEVSIGQNTSSSPSSSTRGAHTRGGGRGGGVIGTKGRGDRRQEHKRSEQSKSSPTPSSFGKSLIRKIKSTSSQMTGVRTISTRSSHEQSQPPKPNSAMTRVQGPRPQRYQSSLASPEEYLAQYRSQFAKPKTVTQEGSGPNENTSKPAEVSAKDQASSSTAKPMAFAKEQEASNRLLLQKPSTLLDTETTPESSTGVISHDLLGLERRKIQAVSNEQALTNSQDMTEEGESCKDSLSDDDRSETAPVMDVLGQLDQLLGSVRSTLAPDVFNEFEQLRARLTSQEQDLHRKAMGASAFQGPGPIKDSTKAFSPVDIADSSLAANDLSDSYSEGEIAEPKRVVNGRQRASDLRDTGGPKNAGINNGSADSHVRGVKEEPHRLTSPEIGTTSAPSIVQAIEKPTGLELIGRAPLTGSLADSTHVVPGYTIKFVSAFVSQDRPSGIVGDSQVLPWVAKMTINSGSATTRTLPEEDRRSPRRTVSRSSIQSARPRSNSPQAIFGNRHVLPWITKSFMGKSYSLTDSLSSRGEILPRPIEEFARLRVSDIEDTEPTGSTEKATAGDKVASTTSLPRHQISQASSNITESTSLTPHPVDADLTASSLEQGSRESGPVDRTQIKTDLAISLSASKPVSDPTTPHNDSSRHVPISHTIKQDLRDGSFSHRAEYESGEGGNIFGDSRVLSRKAVNSQAQAQAKSIWETSLSSSSSAKIPPASTSGPKAASLASSVLSNNPGGTSSAWDPGAAARAQYSKGSTISNIIGTSNVARPSPTPRHLLSTHTNVPQKENDKPTSNMGSKGKGEALKNPFR